MSMLSRRINAVNWGYSVALVLLIAGFVIANLISVNLTTLNSGSSKTDSTMSHLAEMFTSLKSAQASWGEYTLTKSNKSLNRYYQKSKEIDSLFVNLYQSSSITEIQKGRMDTLRGLLTVLFNKDSLNPVMRYRKNAALLLDSLKQRSLQNSLLVDSITNVIAGIHEKIQNNAGERNRILSSWSRALKIISYVLLALALYMAVHILIVYNRERSAKNKARREAEKYHRQLEERIAELTHKNEEILRLKGAEKYMALGRMAATIAHDLKNPLNNIRMAASEIEADPEGENRPMYVDIIIRNSDKIFDQINRFLNATAVSTLNRQPVFINEYLDKILEEAADRIRLDNVIVEKHYEKDPIPVAIDTEKMKTAFLNIIFNAIDAMTGGQKVLKLTTLRKDKKCVVYIADNGGGMDAETRSKIFEPYFSSKKKEGTGLGLAQTQNIILNHKGTVEVESALGAGTRFTIVLDAFS